MARSIENILNQMKDKAEQYPELKELETNDSKVSVWGYCKKVIAFAIHYVETLFDELKVEIEKKIAVTEIGTKQWYENEAKKFQHGDSLNLVNNVLTYSEKDKAKMIVDKANISETGNPAELLLKVLKKGDTPLSADEMNGFRVYMNRKKIIGTHIAIRSVEPDTIQLNFSITLDSQFYNKDGTSKAGSDKPIENLITNYLHDLHYNEPFYIGRLTDKLLDFTGVKDIKGMQVHASIADADADADRTRIDDIGRKYESYSGIIRTTFGTESKQSNISYVVV